MKLAFAFPPMLVGGRPLDFGNLWTSHRGLTGSEMMTIAFAKGLSQEHDVTLFIPDPSHTHFNRITIRDFSQILPTAQSFDAVFSTLDVDLFRGMPTGPLRVLLQQINGFEYTAPDFDQFVDVFVSPSQPHLEMMTSHWPTKKEKWVVVSNGCYPSEDMETKRVPGRVIYASSPDRGLHLVLQEWLSIRRAVPHAHLKIFYYSGGKWLSEWRGQTENPGWQTHWKEHCRRAHYIDKAIPLLASHGVEMVGGVSRVDMAKEMAMAEVMAYPCDPIAWTEGFSCASMEGCAYGALPIISDADALGHIYKNACPMVASPAHKHAAEWRKLVIKALTQKPWADKWRMRGLNVSGHYSWDKMAKKLETVVQERLAAR